MTTEFATNISSWAAPLGSKRNEACQCGGLRKASSCHPEGNDAGTKYSVPLPKEGGLKAWVAGIVDSALKAAYDEGFKGWIEYSAPVPVKQPSGTISFRLYWIRHDTKPEFLTLEQPTLVNCATLFEAYDLLHIASTITEV